MADSTLKLWFRDADGVEHEFMLQARDESNVVLLVSDTSRPDEDGNALDLLGLDRYVDDDTGAVSLNIGHLRNFGDPLNADWETIISMDDDYMERRTEVRDGSEERAFFHHLHHAHVVPYQGCCT